MSSLGKGLKDVTSSSALSFFQRIAWGLLVAPFANVGGCDLWRKWSEPPWVQVVVFAVFWVLAFFIIREEWPSYVLAHRYRRAQMQRDMDSWDRQPLPPDTGPQK